ncbi:MAG: hypothetical protein IPG33_11650 [Betaproteobacteria bacterium]|nr:hypothetical protein [Betaproteobacteria bacterium]
MMDDDTRSWMRALPRRLHLDIGGRRLAVVHGGAHRINEYSVASTPPDIKYKEIEATGCDGVLSGHCGLPFTEIVDGRLWHNAGAIGIPANDGTHRTWYSTITPYHGKLCIELHPLDYDYQITARKMRQAGLSERYALALQTGLWPAAPFFPRLSKRSADVHSYQANRLVIRQTIHLLSNRPYRKNVMLDYVQYLCGSVQTAFGAGLRI